jgi:hypothetical protein
MASAFTARASITMEAKRPKARIEHAADFAFRRRRRPGGARPPHRRALAIACRTAGLLLGRLIKVFALECLPKPLQFQDQRRTLRPDPTRSKRPMPRRVLFLRMINHLHDATLSASAAR